MDHVIHNTKGSMRVLCAPQAAMRVYGLMNYFAGLWIIFPLNKKKKLPKEAVEKIFSHTSLRT